MQIEVHAQPEAIKRWQQLIADPEFARLPFKIETDRFGHAVMSPPPAFRHTRQVGKIIKLLSKLLPDGQAVAEIAINTADGIKVPDVAWISPAYSKELEDQDPPALSRAPEICIEVLSPSNSAAEMAEKCALYFDAGAAEVWLCGLDGKLEFYTPASSASSTLCPQFPHVI